MTATEVERLGMKKFEGYLKSMPGWTYMFTDSRTAEGLRYQMQGIDYIVNGNDVMGMEVELKTEQKYTGNIFLEVWADAAAEPAQPGWLMKINPEILACLFLDQSKLIMMNFRDLKGWYFGSGRFVTAKRVKVGAHNTRKYTVGHLISISEVAENIDIITVNLPYTPCPNEVGMESLIHLKV